MKNLPQRRCFKIGGNNVNGASCQAKLGQMLTFALSFDIFCFQDTRLVNDPLQGDPSLPGSSNPALWKGLHFFLKGKASSTGLLIVVPPSSSAKLLVYHPPPSDPLLAGRYQRLDFVLENEPYSLHNLYVPSNPQQRIAFLSLVHRLDLLNVPSRTNISTGDFNCCLSPFDVTGGGLRDQGATQLEAILNAGLLIDAWRHNRGPTEIDFTRWHSQGPSSLGSGSRIDLFVISASALARHPTIHSDILGPTPYTSDHLPISLSLPLHPVPRSLAAARFHFSSSLFTDDETTTKIRDIICSKSASILATADHKKAMELWIEMKEAVQVEAQERGAKVNKQKLEELSALRKLSSAAKEELIKAYRLGRTHSLSQRPAASQPHSPTTPIEMQLSRLNQDPKAIAALKVKELHWLETIKRYQSLARELAEARIKVDSILHHCLGGRPTRFYHNLTRKTHPPTFIASILPPDATATTPTSQAALWATDQVRVLGYFSDFYSADSEIGRFRTKATDGVASQKLLSSLPRRLPFATPLESERKINKAEILKALRSSPLEKVPGNDGLTYEFYRFFWEDINDAFVHVFNLAYLSDDPAPLTDILTGLITLIYKGGGKVPELIGSYRPICLLGCDIKILSMVLLNRLGGPVGHVVNILQGAFLQGRDISHNIQYFYGMLDHLKGLGHPIWNILLDFETAFDSPDRDRFYEGLEYYGFNNTCIDVRWFKLFLTGTNLQVLVNGFRSAPFPSRRGFPQGLSLSTFMWLLEANKWHSRANQLVMEGRWIRPPIPSEILGILPAHLKSQLLPTPDGSLVLPPFALFADDANLTEVEGSLPHNIQAIEELLDDVERGTGVRANLSKSEAIGYTGSESPTANTGKFKKITNLHQRHLGLPINSSYSERQKEAFSKYPGSMIGTWASYKSCQPCLFERVHLTRACLASKLVYQTRHIALPRKKEAACQRTCFQKLCHSDRPEEPLTILPRQEILALHKSEGGLGAASMSLSGYALQGQTIASLFSPGCHPWKIPLWLETLRTIKPHYNSVATLFIAPKLILPLLRKEHRLLAMAKAWSEACAFRIVDVASQHPLSTLAEPLFGNYQICEASQPLTLTSFNSSTAPTWSHLRDIRTAYHSRGSLDQQSIQDLDSILAALPLPWLHTVTDPSPPELGHWLVVDDYDGYTQVICVDPAYPPCLFRVTASGLLQPLPTTPTPSQISSQRSASVFLPSSFDHNLSPAIQDGMLFIGEWSSMPFDPLVWGLGNGKPIILTESCDIKWRIGRIKALAKVPGYVPHLGLHPPTWEHGSPLTCFPPNLIDDSPASGALNSSHPSQTYTGLAKLETDWRIPPPAAPQVSGSQRDQMILSNHPPWVQNPNHCSPRVNVRDRVAARQAAPFPLPPPPPPRHDDSINILQVAAGGGDKTTHQEPWRRINKSDLPLSHRGLAWQLLHGVLPCKAFIAHRHRKQPGEEGGCEACGRLETLTHTFISCSRVKGAVEWLLNLWFKITGDRPPLDPRVILIDDQRIWSPGPSKNEQQLWQRLRLIVLFSIWVSRCSREIYASAADGDISVAAIKMAEEEIKTAIKRDFTRTRIKEAMVEAAVGNIDSSGRDLSLSIDDFKARWTIQEILCSVVLSANGSTSLQVQDPATWRQVDQE